MTEPTEEYMKLLEVVKALADSHPTVDGDDMWHWCALCGASLPLASKDHELDCPWRMAKEILP